MMGQNSLIYSFVARDTVVLAEYSAFSGNFSTIAAQCLKKLPAKNNKFTYTCDRHTFNYLVEDGFTYLVVAAEEFGRQIPFAFLDRVKEDFRRRYGGGRADTAIAHSLDKEFGSKLKEHMQFCVEHREEMNKLSKIKADVSEVQRIMLDNIEMELDRSENLAVVVAKADNLQNLANNFQRKGRDRRRKMWFQTFKVKLIVLAILIVVIVILIICLSICHVFKCK